MSVSYRDDVTGLRARASELESELTTYRAAGPSGTEVRIGELTVQRANLARLARPYAWLLLEPLAWWLVRAGQLDGASPVDRLALCLVPPLLAVAHLACLLRAEGRSVRARCQLAYQVERHHDAALSAAGRHAARSAHLEAEIREIEHALGERREALVRHSTGPGALPVALLVFSAIAAAMGTGHATSFEPAWSGLAVVGFLGFLLGVASLAARVGLIDETPAALRARLVPPAAHDAAPSERAELVAEAALPAQRARMRNDYALELSRVERLEAELASYRHAGRSGPAMRLLEVTREARSITSHWQPFTWLAFELAVIALARAHTLPLSLLDAMLVPPGVVLAAFALHAFGRSVTLQRRLDFALSERALFGAPVRRTQPAAGAEVPAVRASQLEAEACARSLGRGRRERRTSFLLFAGAVGAFLASVGSLTPRAGAHGAMVLGMVIGVSVLTALAALGFLAFAMVQVVHRSRLLVIARLAAQLERKKQQHLDHERVRLRPAPVLGVRVDPMADPRVRIATPPIPADVSSGDTLPLDSSRDLDDERDREEAPLARHFA